MNSLATKIILFVFASTFVTALAVSWTSIQATYQHLVQEIHEQYPTALERAATRVGAWLEQRGGVPEAPDARDREQLHAVLRAEPPALRADLLLVDRAGNLLATAAPTGKPHGPTDHLPGRIEAGHDSIGEFTTPQGLRMIGGLRPVGDSGWFVAVEAPFHVAFAPVRAMVTQVFVVDLLIILVFSYLAFKITTAVVRPIETLSEAAREIARGQFDHEIPEPATHDEIGLLTRTFNDMMRRLRGYQSEIEATNQSLTERNEQLQQAKETFEQLSITDGLTKLHNHRFFQDHLTREIKRVNRTGEPLSILLLDIDDFKRLNDRLGHASGDELLLGMARIMNETVRDSDLLARYGGEEFVVLATNTDVDGAYRLAEKIRTSIAETSFILDDSLRPTRITVSIGVALYSGNRKEFFAAADRALYRAKAQGKNCVVLDGSHDVL
jgi:diguanylate cyclase (GGDEF)-like protein